MSTQSKPSAPSSTGAAFVAGQSPCYCIRLRRAASMATEFYDKQLKAFGITVNQFSLMMALKMLEGCGTGELARHLGLEKSTLVRTMQPLRQANLIEDSAEQGRRAHKWRLTAAGSKKVDQALPVWKQAQATVRKALQGQQHLLFEQLAGFNTLANT